MFGIMRKKGLRTPPSKLVSLLLLRFGYKLFPILGAILFAITLLFSEGTHIFVHIFTYLSITAGIVYYMRDFAIRYTPQEIDKAFVYIAVLVSCAILRGAFAPGLMKLFLATLCFAAVLLIINHFVPWVVMGLMFVIGWGILSYRWLLWEFCRHNAWTYNNVCSLGWLGQALGGVLLFSVWWVRKYRRETFNHAVRAAVIFPYLFGFLFLCSWWCLVSVSTFWMIDGPYTKAQVLKHIPAEYSLGSDVINTEYDLQTLLTEDKFPVFFKPNMCTGEARGICPIDNFAQAKEYLRIRNTERPERSTVMQTFHNTGYEAVIIYYRYPYYSKGFIKTIWTKANRVPFTNYGLRERVLQASEGPRDLYFYSRDTVPTPIREDIAQSQELIDAIDSIAQSIPSVYTKGITVCRFDVKYDSDEELKNGIFKVLEIDMPTFGDRREKEGASDESKGKPNFVLAAKQARTVALWFYIGAMNIIMGNTLGPIDTIAQIPKLVTIANVCEYRGSMSPVTPGIQ